ncbi:phosphatase PAP2 family protein [Foetidibacter luteolus]|uniref:phosphatase PAP2 family protein n=1 Tax=Foetidibacter luteolus TaxID=2608880 RepID=UPI00129B570E|nr:phosphatase PAP2 family protein [Foetidibacter luteolus]
MKKYYHRYIITAVLALTACFGVQGQNFDINTLKNINPDNPSSGYWKTTSASAYYIGAGLPVGLWIAGALSSNKETQLNAYELAGTFLVSTIISQGAKRIIRRDRPVASYPDLIHPYEAGNDMRSFPSGHTSVAFATATTLALEYKKWYITVPAYAWAASVGYSRMYLGVHYPTDILGGAAVGIGSGYLNHWLNKKLFRRK